MQIYLEHLFKYVSKRQGYNLHTKKKLGEILVDYRIENFCHLKLEYDKLNVLKAINHYGNKYKHNKILDFNFQQFMQLMEEVYIISTKIFNYYYQTKNLQITPLNGSYYRELMLLNDQVENKLIDLESDLNTMTVDLEIKEGKLIHLQQENDVLRTENKILKKSNQHLVKQADEHKKCFEQQCLVNHLLKTEHTHLLMMVRRDIKNTLFPYKRLDDDVLHIIKKP
jgi:hypothetical protein